MDEPPGESEYGWLGPVFLGLGAAVLLVGGIVAGVAIAMVAVGGDDTVTASGAPPTVARAATATPKPATATPRATAAPSATPAPSVTPTVSATPTNTPAATPSQPPSPTPTPTAAPTQAPAATPTPVPPAPTTAPALALARTSFSLPGDATPNGGGFIGPFRGDRRTLVITATDGATVGYAYFFSYSGDAFDAAGDTLYPNLRVLLNDANSTATGAITISAGEFATGMSRSGSIGRLDFTLTITGGSTAELNGQTYIAGNSVGAALSVSLR
ncbi:MAG: hypothetical protein HYX53_00995 [Chloroflexi bacterium]|nr:hypothetical protein [Chloroflexota bacterium]